MLKDLFTTAIVAIFAIVASASAAAQGRIDKIVKELEKDQRVTVTYTELRNPNNKKLYKQNIILNGNSKAQCEKLWNAFEQERENSVSVTKSRNQSFVIKFQDKESTSSYVLSIKGTSWSLAITKNALTDGYTQLSGLLDFSGELYPNLDGLDCLSSLNSLEGLSIPSDLDEQVKRGKIEIHGSDGNVIIYDLHGNRILENTGKAKSKGKKNQTVRSVSTNGVTTTYIL